MASRIWPRIGVFLTIILGVATVWGFLAGFIAAQIETAFRANQGYEQLDVTIQGEPLIRSYRVANGMLQQNVYETLDRQKVADPPPQFLTGASVAAAPPRRWTDGPITWSQRLDWMNANLQEGARWYVIRTGDYDGSAYLAGYDATSKLPVGYIGRDGFRMTPPTDDMFNVGGAFGYQSGRIVGDFIYGRTLVSDVANASDGRAPLLPWCIFLIDGHRVVEIDTRERKVRTLLEAPDVVSIGAAQLPLPADSPQRKNERKDDDVTERLVVRRERTVAVVNPADGSHVDFVLPGEVQEAIALTVFPLSDQQLLIDWQGKQAYYGQHNLAWSNNAGEVTRKATVSLAGYSGLEQDRWSVLAPAAVVPVPIALALMAFWLIPQSQFSMGAAGSYSEALATSLQLVWPVGLGLLAICFVAAWLVVRWQSKYDRPHTAIWAALVFLTGLPGLAAYLILHGWPLLRAVPRLRFDHASQARRLRKFAKPWPAPAPTGLEVFA